MSSFTDSARLQAQGAWSASASWPEKYAAWKKGPGIGGRAQRGCLGVLLFGIVYIFVPMLILFFVEIVIVGYALVMSALWGIGAAVDGLGGRGRSDGEGRAP